MDALEKPCSRGQSQGPFRCSAEEIPFFGGLFVFIPISYESPTGAAPLSLSDLWVADVKPLSPCPLSQLLRVTLLRIKYLLT